MASRTEYSGSSSTNNQIHIIQPGSNVDREELLQQFTQWDNYLTSSHGDNTPVVSSPQHFTTGYQPLEESSASTHTNVKPSKPHSKVKRFPSIKSKDFTSNQEYNKTKKKGKSIFHRGFLKRSNFKSNRIRIQGKLPPGPKFRNQNEFQSCLNYIDLNSMVNDQRTRTSTSTPTHKASNDSLSQDIRSILFQSRSNTKPFTAQNVVLYKPQNNNTNIVVNKLIPRDIYFNANVKSNPPPLTKRHNTIKRKLSKRDRTAATTKRNRATHRTLNIKRSNTLPASIHTSIPPQQNDVTTVWSKYLQTVIAQRIALRLTLMNSQPPSNASLLNCQASNHSSLPSTSTQERIKIY